MKFVVFISFGLVISSAVANSSGFNRGGSNGNTGRRNQYSGNPNEFNGNNNNNGGFGGNYVNGNPNRSNGNGGTAVDRSPVSVNGGNRNGGSVNGGSRNGGSVNGGSRNGGSNNNGGRRNQVNGVSNGGRGRQINGNGGNNGNGAPMPYQYAYGINDPETGDIKEHLESTSDTGRTEGEFRWMLPNGVFKVVKYYVEGDSGFQAEVTEERVPPSSVTNYIERARIPLARHQGLSVDLQRLQSERNRF